jgi:hypothetical protein
MVKPEALGRQVGARAEVFADAGLRGRESSGDVGPERRHRRVRGPAEQDLVGLGEPRVHDAAEVVVDVRHEPPAVLETATGVLVGPAGPCMTPSIVTNVCTVSLIGCSPYC